MEEMRLEACYGCLEIRNKFLSINSSYPKKQKHLQNITLFYVGWIRLLTCIS